MIRRMRVLCVLSLVVYVRGFGAGGLAEFCFDDLSGIKDTGMSTCLQLQQQGHCQTQSYSKFCHKTCKICTDGAYRRNWFMLQAQSITASPSPSVASLRQIILIDKECAWD